jgi:hypothetical protein
MKEYRGFMYPESITDIKQARKSISKPLYIDVFEEDNHLKISTTILVEDYASGKLSNEYVEEMCKCTIDNYINTRERWNKRRSKRY